MESIETIKSLELNKICRICLSQKGKMKSLFGSCLDTMLSSVADIQIKLNDGLPELICFQCVLQVSRTFRFKNQCENSDKILRQYKDIKRKCLINTEKHIEVIQPFTDPINEQIVMNNTISDSVNCELNENSELENTTVNQICSNGTSVGNKIEYSCEICSKIFKKRKALQRHIKIHDNNKQYKCTECDKKFVENSNLTKHMKKHTGELRNVTGKPNLCTICGKSFKWGSSLSKHMQYHTKNKIYKCSYCPKFYVEKCTLDIHLRKHTGEKPFKCDTCNKSFTQLCNLEKHYYIHRNEKQFDCKICNKKFSQRGYIKIHMRSHTGEKPYQCQECGKCFYSSSNLIIHKKQHTNDKKCSNVDDSKKSLGILESCVLMPDII